MDPPRLKTPALATVYLDNEAVGLMGDPRPRVSKIVAASGRHPESVQVLRGLSATDLRGTPVRLEDTIDRTVEPTKPIYLTSKARPGTVHVPSGLLLPLEEADEPIRPLGTPFPSDDEAVPEPRGPLPRDLGTGADAPPKRKPKPLPDPEWPT